ncbi:hypothetical protein [Streptomyces litchfieldiae]|uniref:ABC transporter n=1 Tax=Streptomyces litchfieldiae TaxID=3075543 RepID=A0ABU2MT01_9ACTN|nr:hypothetical protein [Streptomyces sp. DSM 44938]MDT0344003.1 hypothetical protein [Streptomyces sp. DSM 44938]
MKHTSSTRNRKALSASFASAVAVSLLLGGCGSGDDADEAAAENTGQEETPHGYVEGAEETAEQQSRLVLADGDTGAVHVLDLITEEVVEVPEARQDGGVDGIGGDGRFAYLTPAEAGAPVQAVDSGAWMVDHGDHVHYYRADIRATGTLVGDTDARPVSVHSDTAVTAVTFDDGTVTLLDRAQLEAGSVSPAGPGTLDLGSPHRGTAVPYAQHLLVTVPRQGQDLADAVAVRTRDGAEVATLGEPCPELHGTVVTRHGVVFGCADGALLVAEDPENEGTFTAEKIPYPGSDEADRAWEFSHRPGSAVLAAPAGERGVWTLDVGAGEWTLFDTGPVVAANAVGDGLTLLTLTADGALHAYDTTSGEETAHASLLAEPVAASAAAPPVIEIDSSRAYVNDAAADTVYEIDYNDDLRVARTFPLDFTPTHMVETGR